MLASAAVLTVTAAVSCITRSFAHGNVQSLVENLAPVEEVKADQTDPGKDKPAPDKPEGDKPKPDKPKPEQAKPKANPDDEVVKRIVERSLFCPKPTKAFGAKLTGVLGDMAIFNNSQLVPVGGDVGGGKLVQMGADWVEIEFDGKKSKHWVFGASGTPPSPGAGPAPPGAPGPPGGRRAMRGGRRRGGMPPDGKLTPEMIEQFKKMPPEHRQRALEHMPAEIAEQLKKAM